MTLPLTKYMYFERICFQLGIDKVLMSQPPISGPLSGRLFEGVKAQPLDGLQAMRIYAVGGYELIRSRRPRQRPETLLFSMLMTALIVPGHNQSPSPLDQIRSPHSDASADLLG